MIFKRVTELNQKERRFFIEEVEVFTRLIEVFCEKNEVENNENTDLKSEDYKELYDIGVIKEFSDVKQLKKVLKDKYEPFIKAVKFSKNHKEEADSPIIKKVNLFKKKQISCCCMRMCIRIRIHHNIQKRNCIRFRLL